MTPSAEPKRWMIVSVDLLFLFSLVVFATVVVGRLRGTPPRPEKGDSAAGGPELVAVLLVASTCAASHDVALPGLLDTIRSRLQQQATAEGRTLVTIGVSLDADPLTGITFLRRFGSFDGLVSGGGWQGPGALTYMVRDLHGALAMPQLVLLTRTVTMQRSSISASADSVIGRYIGADQFALLAHRSPNLN